MLDTCNFGRFYCVYSKESCYKLIFIFVYKLFEYSQLYQLQLFIYCYLLDLFLNFFCYCAVFVCIDSFIETWLLHIWHKLYKDEKG